MELSLVNGRYTIEEATQLLNSLVTLSSNYINEKTNAANLTEKELVYSDGQMAKFENYVRAAIDIAKKSGLEYIALYSKITVEYCPAYLTT